MTMAISLSALREPLPVTIRPTRRELMAFDRAKSFRHWIMGWVHEWKCAPIHGVNLPLNESLARAMTAPNPLFERLALKD